jgi:tRNA (guanine10-N2)-methyltransferase
MYLGTTTMDTELAFLTANQALAGPGKLILDPFVGTGGLLYPCAHYGAYVMGCDIDGRQMRGTTKLKNKGIILRLLFFRLPS